jgi:hypothetical protein
MPYRALAAQIIADWRAAERGLEAALKSGDVAEHDRLIREIDRLREEYHRLLDEQMRSGGDPLEPFPAS